MSDTIQDEHSIVDRNQEQNDLKKRTTDAKASLESFSKDSFAKLEADMSSTNLRKRIIGESVVIKPTTEQAPEKSNIYTIKAGDNLTKIAKANGTTIQELARLNGIENPDRIYEGKTIKLRAGTPKTETPAAPAVKIESTPVHIPVPEKTKPTPATTINTPTDSTPISTPAVAVKPKPLPTNAPVQSNTLVDSNGNAVTDGSGQSIRTGSNKPEQGQIIPTPGIKPAEVSQNNEKEKKNDTWYAAENAAKEYAKNNGYELKVEGTGIRAKDIRLDKPEITPSRRNIDLIEEQKFILTKNGKTIDIGTILPEKTHLGPIQSTEELKKKMIELIDKGIKVIGTPEKPITQTDTIRVPDQKEVNDNWYNAQGKAQEYAISKGFTLSTIGSGIMAKGGFSPRRDINMIELQTLTLIKNGQAPEIIGSILPEKGHLTSMKTGDELYSEMRTLIDTGIKKMEKPQIQQAPDNSPEAINKLKSLFTPDITNALKITGIQVLEGYKIQIPGGSFKMQDGTTSSTLSPDRACTKIDINTAKMIGGDTVIDFINSTGKNDKIRIDGKTGIITMKQGSENIERPIGKLPNNQAEKPSNLEQQIDNFKNDKPSYIDILSATDSEIKLKTIAPSQARSKGGSRSVQAKIETTYDAALGEITLKTEKNDPFTKMEWKDITLSNIGISNENLTKLSEAGFGINDARQVANIESKNDKSLLIPTRDGTGFATICPGGTVTIYNKDNPIPYGGMARKPVIYLYPTKKTEISVSVTLSDATMIAEYPKTQGGKWKVEATPRGNLKDITTNKKYSYLFWEAEKHGGFQMNTSNAHCVASSDITEYLEKSLKTLGLNARETNDFMVYWLPVLEQNPYSLIEWKTTEYTDMAKLHISPKPDSLIRVFMVFQKSDIEIKTGNPKLQKSRRNGYSVIEWGGCNMDEGNNIK